MRDGAFILDLEQELPKNRHTPSTEQRTKSAVRFLRLEPIDESRPWKQLGYTDRRTRR